MIDEESDVPIAKKRSKKKKSPSEKKPSAPKKRKPKVKEEDLDGEEEADTPTKPVRKPREKKEKKPSASPRKKKEEDDTPTFKWWEQNNDAATRAVEAAEDGEDQPTEGDIKGDGSIKWTTLQHNGVLFPPPYQPLPPDIKLTYDGNYFQSVHIIKVH